MTDDEARERDELARLAAKYPHGPRNCTSCDHPPHQGRACGAPLTQTIRDDVGIFHRPSGKQWTLLTGYCTCGQYDLCLICNQVIELRDTAYDGEPFWCHRDDQRDADPPHTPESSGQGRGVPRPTDDGGPRCLCGHRISDHHGDTYRGSRACDRCSCPSYPVQR
jgi:hypothetical protein